jgi:hypothetical protein
MIAVVRIPHLDKCPSLEPWDRLHVHFKLDVRETLCSELASRVENSLMYHDLIVLSMRNIKYEISSNRKPRRES